MNKVLVICGPTATGKTALGVQLAKTFDGEIISADSRQVYKDMDIGTGKDLPKQAKPVQTLSVSCLGRSYSLPSYSLHGVPIWLYDVVAPSEQFTVASYQCLARTIIDREFANGKLPIIVGGTGLYIESIFEDAYSFGTPPDAKLRKHLSRKTCRELQQMLIEISPDVWETMNNSDRQNPRRLVRKIEIAQTKQKGRPHGLWGKNIDILYVGLRTEKSTSLYTRIDERVDKRYQEGIVEEIDALLARGHTWDSPAFSGIGYRQWRGFFSSELQREQNPTHILERWKLDEHAYAKRQLTWFKHMQKVRWFLIDNANYPHEVARVVAQWYTGKAI